MASGSKSAGIESQPGIVASWSFTEPDGSSSTFDKVASIEGVLAGTYSFETNAGPVADDPLQNDVAVLARLLPLSSCNNGSAEPVLATVRNLGTDPLTTFTLGFVLNDTVVYSEQVDTLDV